MSSQTIIVERLDTPVKAARGIPQKWPSHVSEYYKRMIRKKEDVTHEEN